MVSPGVFITLALSICVFTTAGLPSGPRGRSGLLASRDTNIITLSSGTNTTKPEPYPAYPVHCLDILNHYRVTPSDCGYVINDNILDRDNVFERRTFINRSYRTEAGGYARARWWYGNCDVSVEGYRAESTMLSFFDVALTANKIVYKCVDGAMNPRGGLSLIGDPDNVFVVQVTGTIPVSIVSAANIFNLSHHQPAASLSRRATTGSEDKPESVVGRSQKVETRTPPTGLSDHLTLVSNLTLSAAHYPVHCIRPPIVIVPAAATDCSYIIDHVILRLTDPTWQLTFGFTDAADIDLSKQQYRQWKHGQCVISIKNVDEHALDTFSLLDVATTARRIGTECRIDPQAQMGGFAKIGTERRGFYVYVGPPWSPARLVSKDAGAESF